MIPQTTLTLIWIALFFYAQTLILHGSVNASFACSDFVSLYVALEVISIATFLLIVYPRSDRSIWVGLRYLFVSNVAMLFYRSSGTLGESLTGAKPCISFLLSFYAIAN